MDEEAHPILDISEPGIKADFQLRGALRNEVAQLLKRNSQGFPGAQPVSFSRKHLEALRREE
jgi:mRNA guanylyltransferase